MTPAELYKAGQLNAAIEAALADVKKNPTDTDKRGFLCELLGFAGEWERIDKQLDALVRQDPELAMGVGLYRQLVRAELARQRCFEEGQVPEFLKEPPETLKLHLRATICLREGDLAGAEELLGQAEEQRIPFSGRCNGDPVADFRDVDDVTASFFEVLTSTGKYYWVPYLDVVALALHSPARPRDLLWRRATLDVRDGPSGEVFLPALYPLTFRTGDEQLRLGRATDWREADSKTARGIGLRMFLVDDEAMTIMQLQELQADD
jgi:type VI secretion system protein ImpE